LVRLRFRQVHDQASAGCDRRRSELDTSRLDAVEVTGRAVCGCTRRLGSVRPLGLAGTVAVTRFAAARFLAIAVVVATGSGDGDGDGRGLGDNRVVVVVKTGDDARTIVLDDDLTDQRRGELAGDHGVLLGPCRL